MAEQQIQAAIKPCLDSTKDDIIAGVTLECIKLQTKFNMVNEKLDAITLLLQGQKKTPAKKADEATPPKEEKPAKQPKADTEKTDDSTKNFPVSAYAWFKREYKINPEYRAKYTDAGMTEAIKKEESVEAFAKKTEDAKASARATAGWAYLKNATAGAGKELREKISADYTEEKAKAASMPALTKEADTA